MQSCDKGLLSTSVYSIHRVPQCLKGYIHFLKIFHGHWGHRQTKGHFKKVAFASGGAGGVAEARTRGDSATPCPPPPPCRTAHDASFSTVPRLGLSVKSCLFWLVLHFSENYNFFLARVSVRPHACIFLQYHQIMITWILSLKAILVCAYTVTTACKYSDS